MPERRRYNLDDLQPENLELVIKAQVYEIPGEIPVPSIVRMMRIKARIEEAGDDIDKMAAELEGLLESGDTSRPGIMELFRMVPAQKDLPTLPLSLREVLNIIEVLVSAFGVEETVEGELPEEPVEDAVPLVPVSSPSA
jgi:hypothetical protein